MCLFLLHRDKFLGGLPIRYYNTTFQKKTRSLQSWTTRWTYYWLPALISTGRISPTRLLYHIKHKRSGAKASYSSGSMPRFVRKAYGHHNRLLMDTFMDTSFTFEEFLRHVVWTYNMGLQDWHWKTFYSRCQPCTYHYDYVVHLESAREDVYNILRSAHFLNPENYSFPVIHVTKTDVDTDAFFFSNIPSDIMQQIFQIYYFDFKLFGYSENINDM